MSDARDQQPILKRVAIMLRDSINREFPREFHICKSSRAQ